METVSPEALRESLLSRNAAGESWAEMAEEYGPVISAPMLWRIAHEGYEPKSAAIRKALRLPQIVWREVWRDAKGRYVREPRGGRRED